MKTKMGIAVAALLATFTAKAAEWVTVDKVVNDSAVVSRQDGSSYLIEVGVGCLGLYSKEGTRVLINSPGMFLGIGTQLLIPGRDQSCRVWNSEPIATGSRRSSGNSCESHWVEKVIDSGKFVTLEDGSLWEIDPVHTIDTMLWLPASDISVCGNELVNTGDGAAVRGRRIR